MIITHLVISLSSALDVSIGMKKARAGASLFLRLGLSIAPDPNFENAIGAIRRDRRIEERDEKSKEQEQARGKLRPKLTYLVVGRLPVLTGESKYQWSASGGQ